MYIYIHIYIHIHIQIYEPYQTGIHARSPGAATVKRAAQIKYLSI